MKGQIKVMNVGIFHIELLKSKKDELKCLDILSHKQHEPLNAQDLDNLIELIQGIKKRLP